MNEFIKVLIERLEEKKEEFFNKALESPNNALEILFLNKSWDYENAIEIVNQLAEEYKGGWIPCSERLPEESGEYYTYVYYDGRYMYSIDEIDCIGILKRWNCSSDYQILAWKPIAPYQPKGE